MDHPEILLLLIILVTSDGFCHGKSPDKAFVACHIDCGASNGTTTDDGFVVWLTDDEFTNSGKNYLLGDSKNFTPMNSLRYFSSGQKNCYKIQFFDADRKVILRAGFAYGNYDGLSRPPSFDLEIDGNLWATVTTSMSEDEAQFYEVIYWTKGDTSNVCLVRTNAGDVPFISSLEGMVMFDYESEPMFENGTALHLHSRINYGANKSIEQDISAFAERYSRYWKSEESSEYLNINKRVISDTYLSGENQPPVAVMEFAIQSKNVTDSIRLPLDLSPQLSSVAYLVFYFMDLVSRDPPNRTDNKVEILVDGVKMGATNFGEYDYHVVTLYPVQVTKPTMEIVIAPAQGSIKAPLINAMEVFYVTTMSAATRSLHTLGFLISSMVYVAWTLF